ncbi:MAG: DUF4145 domain-containing protein [Bryobacteraceae bacterium]
MADINVREMAFPGTPAKIFHAGHRRCPNPSCAVHIFVVHRGGLVLVSYPPETIDFDASKIPPLITTAFEEAIACHSNHCFVAAAIMVRKTLEELCRNRGAKGGNLKEKLKDLKSQIVLPIDLLDGLDDIRLLGNDAAYIEAQVFNQIAQQELDVAIEFTKEVLKAIYRYGSLREKLRALKKSPAP